MSDEQDPPVGYGSPPKHSQFKKGQSQPRRIREVKQTVNVVALISEPWKIGEGRSAKKVHPFEFALQQMTNKAIKGDMRAAAIILKYFERYGLISADSGQDTLPQKIDIPWDHDEDDWLKKYEKHGPPPWPYPHDGISRLAELRKFYGK